MDDKYEPPPLPWRIDTRRDGDGVVSHSIRDGDGYVRLVKNGRLGIADCDPDLFPTIVRAVNLHDTLRAACEVALAELLGERTDGTWQDSVEQVRAALAAAGGPTGVSRTP